MQNPNDYIGTMMDDLNADGVDFIPLSEALMRGDYAHCEIIESYTKEEWERVQCYPKTPYLFWCIKNGKKVYQIN